MSNPNSHELLRLHQEGQSEAATTIFNRYVERLIALVRSRIGQKLQRRIDPEDVVQSAYRSFFVHAENEAFQLSRSGDLWRLLASIALNKLYGQVERQSAAKRSIDREEFVSASLANVRAPEPTAAEMVAIVEQLQLVIDGLSFDERTALTMRLQGQGIGEISRALDKSERTIRRLLSHARKLMEDRLLSDAVRATFCAEDTSISPIETQSPLNYSDYVLERLLGAGGMGKVFRARESNSGRKVAVKALHKSRHSDKRAIAQFIREAQMLAKLSHPNIVGIQGLGQFPGGGYFIVMDFIDGSDLQTQLQQGPLSMVDAIAIIRQIASAVEYSHRHNIIHCDLKPGNILLEQNNRAIVTDFGFAFMVAGASEPDPSLIGGTKGYLAPELFHRQGLPTPKVDIYALGVLLWQLVSGVLPESGTAILAENNEHRPLEVICRRCMAVDPGQRYSTVAELIKALDKL